MTSKTKNILLIVGFLFAIMLCYQLAISKTIALKKEYDSLKEETLLFKNTSKQVSILKQKQKYYDSILNKYQIKGSSIQNNLLKTINTFSEDHKLKTTRFLEPHIAYRNDLAIKTYRFTIEGDYNAIVKLIYHLEQNTKFGEITNLHFEKKKNFKTNKAYVQAHVLLKCFG